MAGWDKADLAVARLAEGHGDAVAILAEAHLRPRVDALYGVWAARVGGAGPHLVIGKGERARVDGQARFCSGVRMLDRALVIVESQSPGSQPSPPVLVQVVLDRARMWADPNSWRAEEMAGSDTVDVRFAGAAVARMLGGPGCYTRRPGFAAGGAGIAAVWWVGAAGLLDRAATCVAAGDPDLHQLAHLGELHAMLSASHAVLLATATQLADPWREHSCYERRKRAVLCASLPREHYRSAFEPGCGTATLTLELARRCKRLHSSEPVPEAAGRARRSTARLPRVQIVEAALPAGVPAGRIDLAVFSKVLHYLHDESVHASLDATVHALEPGGDLVLANWRGWPAQAPRDEAATAAPLHTRPELTGLVEHVDEEFVLHVLRRR